MDLSGYGFSTIASVLKRFLLELPDTVIPIQWYNKFIDVSGKILSLDLILFIILISRRTFAGTFCDEMMMMILCNINYIYGHKRFPPIELSSEQKRLWMSKSTH